MLRMLYIYIYIYLYIYIYIYIYVYVFMYLFIRCVKMDRDVGVPGWCLFIYFLDTNLQNSHYGHANTGFLL